MKWRQVHGSLPVPPTTVSGTELSTQEFRDTLFMGYGEAPPDLPAHSEDGCDAPFTLQHALACNNKGGLVADLPPQQDQPETRKNWW